MLAGKKLVVTGVLTKDSIAFEVARQAQEQGAEIVLTGFGRTRRMTERAATRLPEPTDIIELDVNNPDDLTALTADLRSRWGTVDGILHAIAHAPGDALGGGFLEAPTASALSAFQTSAVSLREVAVAVAPLMDEAGGGSVVGLDFDATVAWPAYDWMGVAKAALESVSRYLARDLGARNIRCNLVSAGPIETAAAGGIPGFDGLAGFWQDRAPLGWDPTDAAPVASAVCFLLSDHARAITGEVLHVDGGYHAMGSPLPSRTAAAAAVPSAVA